MSTITDGAIMAALGRQLTKAVAQQAVAAGNLANIDTPGYRAREASFGDVLDGEIGKLALTTTSSNQIASPLPGVSGGTKEVDGLQSRRDGNNVELDRELLTMNKASSDFAAAGAALAAKFRLIRFAINEGR
ncbi:MAG TPA: flagellar basal body rod protein FlgB [Vicinamibacterales bacterium]|nr:flagellar basal body rod protein FlgB [Vicinamibacterales bacterium]